MKLRKLYPAALLMAVQREHDPTDWSSAANDPTRKIAGRASRNDYPVMAAANDNRSFPYLGGDE